MYRLRQRERERVRESGCGETRSGEGEGEGEVGEQQSRADQTRPDKRAKRALAPPPSSPLSPPPSSRRVCRPASHPHAFQSSRPRSPPSLTPSLPPSNINSLTHSPPPPSSFFLPTFLPLFHLSLPTYLLSFLPPSLTYNSTPSPHSFLIPFILLDLLSSIPPTHPHTHPPPPSPLSFPLPVQSLILNPIKIQVPFSPSLPALF